MNAMAADLLDVLVGIGPVNGRRHWRELIEMHADTAFGKAFGFSSIRTAEDFRTALPPMDYEAYRPWIERAGSGESGVLASGTIIGFERTSGTSSSAKWIPVTEKLRGEFAAGMASWFLGWKRRCPEVFDGRAYWAISPPGMSCDTPAANFQPRLTGDAAYFPEEIGGRLAKWLVAPELSGHPAAVFDETAEALLAVPDLSLVSVWSPTFLLGIDDALRRRIGDFIWRERWPRLARVSCWADAASALWLPRLKQRLGGVPVEPKGLLATEGITSLPDGVDGTPRLAVECHWHEFLDEEGNFVDLPEVRVGRVYQILLTTAGGFFRYRSGDLVRVTAIGVDGLPRLRFIGRGGASSDLVGEKLHEDQVASAMVDSGAHGFMVPDPRRPGYDLWLEETPAAQGVIARLKRNPYFAHAVEIGQLDGIRVRRLRDGWSVCLTTHLAARRGCRMGDVKPPVLILDVAPELLEQWLD